MVRISLQGFALLLCACTVEPLPLTGLDCPCPTGYFCACEGMPGARCLPDSEEPPTCMMFRDAGADGGGMPDAGPDAGADAGADAGPDDADGMGPCDGRFKIEGLRQAWNTPNVIAIAWTVVTRDAALFDQYFVELRSGDEVIMLDRNTVPEFGEYELDGTGSTGTEAIVVEAAWLRNLPDGRNYDMTLIARDISGGECRLMGSASTPQYEDNGSFVIYSNGVEGGDELSWLSPVGACTSTPDMGSFAGDRHVRLSVACPPPGQPTTSNCVDLPEDQRGRNCYTNVLLGLQERPIPSDLSFADAYLEFRLQATGEGLISSDWSLHKLEMLNETGWLVTGFTIPINQGYQTFQIPLTAYVNDETEAPMMPSDLANLYFFMVGGTWADSLQLDVDEVILQW